MAKLLGHDDERYRRYRAQLAPGTPLRDGLERIRLGHTGALVVLGTNKVVEQVSTGGFTIDCDYTPTALRELAKMDGGIVLSNDLSRILAAGVHFTPSGEIPTIETGTRHRTADRVAVQSNVPVVTVSAAMSTIALFMSGLRYGIESSDQILIRAEQALDTLLRYRERLDQATEALSTLEVEGLVTVGDLIKLVQPLTMVRRLADEMQGYIEALGVDGRLLQLQHYELTSGLDQLAALIEADYDTPRGLRTLDYIATGDLLDASSTAASLGFDRDLGAHLDSRGYRVIAQLGQLSAESSRRVVDTFGSLQQVAAGGVRELAGIEGVGIKRARSIHDGLAKLIEEAN